MRKSVKTGHPTPSSGSWTILVNGLSLKAMCMLIWADIRVQLYMRSVNDIGKTLLQWYCDQVLGIEIVCETNTVTRH